MLFSPPPPPPLPLSNPFFSGLARHYGLHPLVKHLPWRKKILRTPLHGPMSTFRSEWGRGGGGGEEVTQIQVCYRPISTVYNYLPKMVHSTMLHLHPKWFPTCKTEPQMAYEIGIICIYYEERQTFSHYQNANSFHWLQDPQKMPKIRNVWALLSYTKCKPN